MGSRCLVQTDTRRDPKIALLLALALAAALSAAQAPPQTGAQAPPAPQHNGKAHWFKVSALADGTFSVTNSRNGFSKTYKAISGGR